MPLTFNFSNAFSSLHLFILQLHPHLFPSISRQGPRSLQAMCRLSIFLRWIFFSRLSRTIFIPKEGPCPTVVLSTLFIVKRLSFRRGDNLFDRRMPIRFFFFIISAGVHEKGMNPNCGQMTNFIQAFVALQIDRKTHFRLVPPSPRSLVAHSYSNLRRQSF